MTDKEKIRKEVERLREKIMGIRTDFADGQKSVLTELLAFIDSLKEEPVNEDLEEAAHKYADGENPTCPCEECLIKTFKAGAEWQKEQMMEKAVGTTFNVSLPSGLYDKLWIKGCKEGDKLLVTKKDEL